MPERKRQFSVRLPPDTADALDDYCDERDISYADALRRFTDRELQRTGRLTSGTVAYGLSVVEWVKIVLLVAIFAILVTTFL